MGKEMKTEIDKAYQTCLKLMWEHAGCEWMSIQKDGCNEDFFESFFDRGFQEAIKQAAQVCLNDIKACLDSKQEGADKLAAAILCTSYNIQNLGGEEK